MELVFLFNNQKNKVKGHFFTFFNFVLYKTS